jgi:hypothetical protein
MARPGLTDRLKADIEAHDVGLAAAWLHGVSAAINLDRPNPRPVLSRPQGVGQKGHRQRLAAWLSAISERLRHVTVMCGDWVRVLSYTAIHPEYCDGSCAILLDPPYKHHMRDPALYAVESDVAGDVAEWAAEHGQREDLRIILCGLAGEHSMPSGWRYLDTMTLQAASRGKTKRQDRLYLSPHCLPVDGEQPCVEGEPIRRRQKSIFDWVGSPNPDKDGDDEAGR